MSLRPFLAGVLVLALAGCGAAGVDTTTTTVPPSTSTTAAPSTTTTVVDVEPLVDCPPAAYDIGVFPDRVAPAQVPAEGIALDPFTGAPGSHSTIWLDADGGLVLSLVRGALPPEDWPGEKGEVTIDGVRAVAGPFEDGTWVVAWYEEPGARCDRYTMVFYPPVTPAEVEATIESMDRVAG